MPPIISYDDIKWQCSCFVIFPKIYKGTKLEMTIELFDKNKIKVEFVIKVIKYNEINSNQYEIKIKFIDMDEKCRDKLIKYLLQGSAKNKKAIKWTDI